MSLPEKNRPDQPKNSLPSYNVDTLRSFDKELKRLKKKYPSLKAEYQKLIKSLAESPTQGKPLGDDCYKVRLAIASKGKGKSGGGRVITCVKIVRQTVYLLTIYDKSEYEIIPDSVIQELAQSVVNKPQ
ncbi:MAG: addiction module toxin RelE [Planctomycetaceae bacterium]|jgi:mRNA-degrading endonuclease RelE of RelBE toxin-antitoxin system|nr:addiction module toxin RelE [Planctomycetaceae bacterium]